tara:strand:- start:128 stop:733 length:606 start_codon:yes stop_codon:yes gene_type:complete
MVRPTSEFKELSQEGESEEVCVCTATRSIEAMITYDPNDMFNFSCFISVTMTISCEEEGNINNRISISEREGNLTTYSSFRTKQFPSKRCTCPVDIGNGWSTSMTKTLVTGKVFTIKATAAGKQTRAVEFKNGEMFPAELPEFARSILTEPSQLLNLGVGVTDPIEEGIGSAFAKLSDLQDLDREGMPTLSTINNCKECCK